jgi:hypothetical protein
VARVAREAREAWSLGRGRYALPGEGKRIVRFAGERRGYRPTVASKCIRSNAAELRPATPPAARADRASGFTSSAGPIGHGDAPPPD